MKLIGDFWNRNRNEEFIIEEAVLENAIDSLKKLDGIKKTEMILEQAYNSLNIAGGNNGLFILNYFVGEEHSYFLTKKTDEKNRVTLVCGGQSGIFDAKNCFKIEYIFNVISDYYEGKDILSIYKWEVN